MVLSDRFKKVLFIFFLIYLFFNGFIFSFLIPPFQKPDEFEHFKRTISVANFDLKCQKKKQLINKNLFLTVNNFYLKSLPFNYHFKMPFSLYKEPAVYGKITFDISNGCRFKDWIGYLIPAFFYRIFSGLPVNGFILFNFIRFFIFLFCYSILIFFTLKNKNKLIRLLVFFVLSLPMTINQLSAFSYDVGHLFFGLLLINIFFDFKEEKKYSFKKLIFLLTVFFLFIFSKPLYEFFLLLFFLLDKDKLKKIKVKKNLLIFFIFLIIFSFRFLVLEKTGSSLGLYNPNIQKIIILEDPLRMIEVFKKTYFNSFEFYIKSVIGILGWLDFNLNFFVYLSFFVIFGTLIGFYINKVKIESKEIIIYFFIIFFNLLYIFLGEFLYWTEPGADNIVGVQGRYLIIFLPYFFIILLFLIKKYFFYISSILLMFFCYLNFKVTFDRYFDYSVYAIPTANLNRLKKFIFIKPKESKIFKIEKENFKTCYGVYLKFKNKDFKEPVKVEVYDQNKKNYRIIYFPPSRVNYNKEATSISFYKAKFKLPVYIKVFNQYSNKPVKIADGVALNCVF